jgi:hypothetical protein
LAPLFQRLGEKRQAFVISGFASRDDAARNQSRNRPVSQPTTRPVWRESMKASTVLAGLLVVGYVVPAAAQTTYYIVRNPSTRHCEIVDQRPVSQTETVVSPDGVVYKNRVEAENGMKTVKVCHDE